MPASFLALKAAVREFRNRRLDDDIDPEKLRDLMEELECELELLYEPPGERARLRAEAEAAAQELLKAFERRIAGHAESPSRPA